MGIIKRLFKKTPKQTQLEAYVQTLSPEQIMSSYQSLSNECLHLPSAISMTVLYVAGKFIKDIRSIGEKLPGDSSQFNENLPYDVVLFETAAYCHYFIMKDHLKFEGDGDDWENEEEDTEDGTHFQAFSDSLHITSALIIRFTNFSIPEEFFINRVGSYSMPIAGANTRSIADSFECTLISSTAKGSPAIISKESIPGELNMELTAKIAIPIFHKSWLKGLVETVENLYESDANAKQ